MSGPEDISPNLFQILRDDSDRILKRLDSLVTTQQFDAERERVNERLKRVTQDIEDEADQRQKGDDAITKLMWSAGKRRFTWATTILSGIGGAALSAVVTFIVYSIVR